ncbi:ZmpA/ZmpB/ZmpC family metallo-endopeptidase-related protein [Endozoicomonas acroporae]|uniref:ZmpA/ZmpB/ZmpC family metallo-endopeptidase-related protein n=3 Tax=Endozoicomonas acroporae TaxID=1701104 RepID=UPI0013D4A2E8|nr:ZmpA/ZmpB/ZmpC family metallo-endopeptidase-related protein [Endozoicomonas acroporae]
MIRQSGVNPAGMAINPQPGTTPTTEPEGRWRGWEVIQTGASAFIWSLHPLYDPLNSHRHLPVQDVADSAAGIDLWGVVGQNNNFHQFTALAGRAIAAYSGLPPEINSLLSYLANLAAVGRIASDQLNAFNACGGSIPEPGTHREKTPDETLENTKGKARKASQNLRHQYDKSAAPTLRASQLPSTPLALGALVGLSAVGAASASASDRWINVADAENLGKICRDKGSCSKQYRLTDDFNDNQLSRSIGSKKNPFTGKLDGNYRTIGKLSKCLVKHLSDEGRIENLTLSDAKITSTDPAGVVACEMSDNAKISNIRVERADVDTKEISVPAAIGVGSVDGGGTITNMTALNCTVKTYATYSHAGIGAGYLIRGAVNNMAAVNCSVTAKRLHSHAGIGAGTSKGGNVSNTMAVNCHVEAMGKSDAGIGVGYQLDKGTVTDTTALSCTVKTNKADANAGIGAGHSKQSTVDHTTAVNCHVVTIGEDADAGIGAGHSRESTVDHTTAVNCHVVTIGEDADAGIGAGVLDIGVGVLGKGTVHHTTAVNCTVITSGSEANAGIGAGRFYQALERIANTRVFNSTVKSENATAKIFGGSDPIICNVTVNSQPRGTPEGCRDWQNNDICADIAPDLAKLKHQIVNYCSGTSSTKTMTTTPGSTATFAAPTPPVASPSPAVIACIATLGTVIIVLVGVIAYRYFSQRSSTNAGRNRAEPMPPPASGRPRAEGQLPTPPRDHYQPLSFRPRNKRPLPAPPLDHYQPLSFRPRNTRPLPAPPGHYQTLTFRQGNTATGDYNPLMGNEKEPAPSDIPVYLELIGYESTDNHGEPVADGQPGIATGGSNPLVGNEKEPAPPDSVYLEPIGYESTDNHGEPVADGQAGIATGRNSVANTGKPTRPGSPVYHVLTEHGTDSDDNHGEPAGRQRIAAAPWRTLGKR